MSIYELFRRDRVGEERSSIEPAPVSDTSEVSDSTGFVLKFIWTLPKWLL